MNELNDVKRYTVYGVSTVLTIAIGYGVYMSRGLLPSLGTTVIICMIIAAVASTVTGIGYVALTGYKKFHDVEPHDIGQYGTLIHKHGVVSTYKPMHAVSIREEKTANQLVPVKPTIPTMRELLVSGYLQRLNDAGKMLLGYRIEDDNTVTPYIGSWDDLRILAIAGKSRYGKTVTMINLIFQAVMAHAYVVACDTNFTKPSSLAKHIQPLEHAGLLTVARQMTEVQHAIDSFAQTFIDRRDGNVPSEQWNVQVMFIDEYTSIAVNKFLIKSISNTLLQLANQGAGYNMYFVLAGQNWQASMAGGNALINSMQSAMIHHIDTMESRRLIDRQYSMLTPKLLRGTFFLKDTAGEVSKLSSPLSTTDDCTIVVQTLATTSNINEVPIQYSQKQFTDYNPKVIPQQSSTIKHIPVTPVPSTPDTYTDVSSDTTVATPLNIKAPENFTKPQIGKSGVDVSVEHTILTAVLELKIKRSIVLNDKEVQTFSTEGKVIRTVLRDYLGMNNKQYSKLIMPVCNTYDL